MPRSQRLWRDHDNELAAAKEARKRGDIAEAEIHEETAAMMKEQARELEAEGN